VTLGLLVIVLPGNVHAYNEGLPSTEQTFDVNVGIGTFLAGIPGGWPPAENGRFTPHPGHERGGAKLAPKTVYTCPEPRIFDVSSPFRTQDADDYLKLPRSKKLMGTFAGERCVS